MRRREALHGFIVAALRLSQPLIAHGVPEAEAHRTFHSIHQTIKAGDSREVER
jgi:hypothetical protein